MTVENTSASQIAPVRQDPIRKVALCGGAGAFLLDAAIKAGADAFITGEMSYHEFFGRAEKLCAFKIYSYFCSQKQKGRDEC